MRRRKNVSSSKILFYSANDVHFLAKHVKIIFDLQKHKFYFAVKFTKSDSDWIETLKHQLNFQYFFISEPLSVPL